MELVFFKVQFALIMIPIGILCFWDVTLVAWFYITDMGITLLLLLEFFFVRVKKGYMVVI